jgi:predicted O-methyltransferase YrrM
MLKHAIFWSDIPGWFDFADIYNEMVRKAEDGFHFVEVGSCWGRSASYMAWKLKKARKKVRFDCVDAWYDNTAGVFEWYMRRAYLIHMVNPVHLESVLAAGHYKNESLDFIFIDADHTYEGVLADLCAWYPKLKPGCLMAGHDFNSDWPGVVQAVDEFFKGKANPRGNSWVYLKPQEN